MCIFFYPTFIRDISHSKMNSARHCHKYENVSTKNTRYSYRILIKLEFSRQIFQKAEISNFIKIHHVGDELIDAGGRMNMTKLRKQKTPEHLPSCAYERQHAFQYLYCCLHSPRRPATPPHPQYNIRCMVTRSGTANCSCAAAPKWKHCGTTWREEYADAIKSWVYKHLLGTNLYRVWVAHLAHLQKTPPDITSQ